MGQGNGAERAYGEWKRKWVRENGKGKWLKFTMKITKFHLFGAN